jgi:NAD(P)-dependent dehydrogenase (short-subunit alcohol dehydrogenase family)
VSRTILVTGASKGIGRAIALRLEQIPVNYVYIRHGGSSSWRDADRD